jgi:hypothetical protein
MAINFQSFFNNKHKRTQLLVFKGIFPEEFTTEIIMTPVYTSTDISYTVLPTRYTGIESWPQKSNLRCWNCDLIPLSAPRFIPVNSELALNGKKICDRVGHFCMANCAVSYVVEHYPAHLHRHLARTIAIFEEDFDGKAHEEIYPAPPKTLMTPYRGDTGLSILQWRQLVNEMNREYQFTKLA